MSSPDVPVIVTLITWSTVSSETPHAILGLKDMLSEREGAKISTVYSVLLSEDFRYM